MRYVPSAPESSARVIVEKAWPHSLGAGGGGAVAGPPLLGRGILFVSNSL